MKRVSEAAQRLRMIGNVINQQGAPTAILFPAADLLNAIYEKHENGKCSCVFETYDEVCHSALLLAETVLINSAPLKHA